MLVDMFIPEKDDELYSNAAFLSSRRRHLSSILKLHDDQTVQTAT